MTRTMQTSLRYAVGAALITAGAAQAQQEQKHDNVTCRAGTVSVLAKEEKLIVWQLDHRGVSQANDPTDPFHGATQRCVGTVAIFEGKVTANGWCKTVVAKTGDWVLVDWRNDDKPGQGTWTYRFGTGAFKGVSGGGTYHSLGQTRPIEAGTYQNCVRVQGTRKMPG